VLDSFLGIHYTNAEACPFGGLGSCAMKRSTNKHLATAKRFGVQGSFAANFGRNSNAC